MTIPLDVFMEIASLLEPIDLLRLSRSTKFLRGILLNRQNAVLWRRARANIMNLLDCPDELSEPEYASLVFDRHCTVSTIRCSRVTSRRS